MGKSQAKADSREAPAHQHWCGLEALEPRLLLSASVSVQLDPEGTVMITGDDGADIVVIRENLTSGNLEYSFDGIDFSQDLDSETPGDQTLRARGATVRVDLGEGRDRIEILGTAGQDVFDISPQRTTLGSVDPLSVEYENIEELALRGEEGSDVFHVAAAASNGPRISLDGGRDTDTLMASDVDNTWDLTRADSGSINGGPRFEGIENLVGGSGDDEFIFADGARITGVIDGGGGFNTLDYSAYSSDVEVAMVLDSSTGAATGTGGITNIQYIVFGGGAQNRLILDFARPAAELPVLATVMFESVDRSILATGETNMIGTEVGFLQILTRSIAESVSRSAPMATGETVSLALSGETADQPGRAFPILLMARGPPAVADAVFPSAENHITTTTGEGDFVLVITGVDQVTSDVGAIVGDFNLAVAALVLGRRAREERTKSRTLYESGRTPLQFADGQVLALIQPVSRTGGTYALIPEDATGELAILLDGLEPVEIGVFPTVGSAGAGQLVFWNPYGIQPARGPPPSSIQNPQLTDPSPVREVVFVDAAVMDRETLLEDILQDRPAVEVIILDANRDGIEQITEVLAGFNDLRGIHILSHGSSGYLFLGNAQLSVAGLAAYADMISMWQRALGDGADLLLYGCNVADAGGIEFVRNLADLTGADVAASNDLTGADVLGGDWDLEFRTGQIEISALRGEAYGALLGSPTDYELAVDQVQGILDGIQGLVDWAQSLDEHDLFAVLLPVIGQSLGEALDLGNILEIGLLQPVTDYFDNDLTPTTDELVAQLENLGNIIGDLTILDPASVIGGLVQDAFGDEVVFSFVLEATRSFATGIGLGPEGKEFGFSFDSSITVDAEVTVSIDFSFGFDVSESLDPIDSFFIRLNDLSATASASAAALANAGVNTGFFGADLIGLSSSLDLMAVLQISLTNPDGDLQNSITLDELQDTPLESLVSFMASGSANGSIEVAPGSIGSFTPGGTAVVTFNSTNPFEAPELQFDAAFDELLSFTGINASGVLDLLGRLGDAFDDLRATDVLDIGLQLVGQTGLGDVLNLGGVITFDENGQPIVDDGLFVNLIANLLIGEDLPTFDSAQELEMQLEQLLGQPVDATYDELTNELTYRLEITQIFADQQRPLAFGFDLGPLVNVGGAAPVNVGANATASLTLGIDLSEFMAVLVASGDGPASGKIFGDDMSFSLSIGGGLPVSVTVAESDTDDNISLDDLVADINTAFTAAGISGNVVAGRQGDRITISTTGFGVVAALVLFAGDDNPIVTQLKFADGQTAIDTIVEHAFIEDVSVEGTASLSIPDIDATANFGPVKVSIADGSFSANIGASLGLVNGGRILVTDLIATILEDAGSIVDMPTVTGSVNGELPIQVSPDFVGGLPGTPKLTVSWPDVTDLGTLQITPVDLDVLANLQNLNGAFFVSALGSLADYLQTLEGFDVLAQKLPGIDLSIAEIIDLAERFSEMVTLLEARPDLVIQEMETIIQEALGLDDSQLQISLVEANTVLRIDLTLEKTVSIQKPLSIDLNDTEQGDLGNLVDAGAESLLDVEGGVLFDLDFGVDFSDPDNPAAFLYDTTALNLSARVNATGINFTAAVGLGGAPVGLFIIDGSVAIDGDGNANTTGDKVTLEVSLTDNNGDGKIFLSELGLGNASTSLVGQAALTLPIYLPVQTNFIGNLSLAIPDLSNPGNVIPSLPNLDLALDQFVALSTENTDAIIAGLLEFTGWADKLAEHDLIGKFLPVIGISVGRGLNIKQILDDILLTAVQNYFDVDVDPSANGLVTALKALTSTLVGVTVTVDEESVVGGESSGPGGSEIVFSVAFNVSRTLLDQNGENLGSITLGEPGYALGISIKPDVGIEITAVLDVDLSFGLTSDAEFFIRVNELKATVDADAGGGLAGGEAKVGVYPGGTLASADFELHGELAITLNNPDGDPQGYITLDELQNTALSSLISLDPSGSATASIGVTMPEIFGISFFGTPTVSLVAEKLFEQPPKLIFNDDFKKLLDFASAGPDAFIGALDQLGRTFDDLSDASLLEVVLFVAGEFGLGDLVNFSGTVKFDANTGEPTVDSADRGLMATLISKLFKVNPDVANSYVLDFDDVLGFANLLDGLNGVEAVADYDEAAKELTYDIAINFLAMDGAEAFEVDKTFDLGLNLGKFGGITGATNITLQAGATLDFTVGFDLGAQQAILLATNDVNGVQLSADSSFTLSVGAGAPVPVLITKSSTDNNVTMDDLVADINAALFAAGLGGSVQAGRDGNKIKLETTGTGVLALLLLNADESDPVVTDLKFKTLQAAADTLFNHMFLEDVSFTAGGPNGNPVVAATGINASANFGIAGIDIVGGSATVNLAASVTFNPPGGRIDLLDLLDVLDGDIGSMIQTSFEGSVMIDLPVEAQILNFTLPANANLFVNWPDIKDFGTLDFGGLEDLFKLENLTKTDIINALGSLVEYLASLEEFDFLA